MSAQGSAPIAKLGYVALGTPDPERLLAYYTGTLSLTQTEEAAGAHYLTTGPDHHCIVIEPSADPGSRRIGLELRGSLEEAESALQEAGISAERRSEPEPGIAEALLVAEPGSGIPIHLYETQAASEIVADFGLRPVKLGHVAHFTRDLAASQSFCEQRLGFRWSDTIGDFFVFLRCGPDHHALNFLASEKLTGMHHIAFEARDTAQVTAIVDHLAGNGYPLEWGPGRHGVGHNVFTYHRDPDGNVTEIFTELDLIFDEETGYFEPRPWHEELPQGPKVWEPSPGAANKWGPVNPAMLEH